MAVAVTGVDWRRTAPVAATVLLASLIVSALAGCADFEAPPFAEDTIPDTLVAEPTLSRDVQPIFTARCATSSCHTAVTHQANLVLEAPYTYESIVNRPSLFRPELMRVHPGEPDSSMIALVIGPNPPITRMPLGRRPLTANQIQTIRNWIARGATP